MNCVCPPDKVGGTIRTVNDTSRIVRTYFLVSHQPILWLCSDVVPRPSNSSWMHISMATMHIHRDVYSSTRHICKRSSLYSMLRRTKSIHSLGTATFDDSRPFVRIKVFGSEIRCKFLIRKSRPEVLLHVLDIIGDVRIAPIGPEPFGALCRHRIHAPMNEYSDFCFIVPLGQWTSI